MPRNSHLPVQDTIIAQSLQIKGNLNSLSNLHFDGTIVGNIKCESDVTIGPNAFVEGKITCQNLEVDGTVVGNLEAGSSLVLHSNAKIQGDINTQSLVIEDGAHFTGGIQMPKPTASLPEHSETETNN